jgi:hypothetical protein
VVLNSANIPELLRKRYAQAQVKPVENDFEALATLGVKVVTADLIGDTSVSQKVRHDPASLAEVVMDLAARSRALQLRKLALSAKNNINER